ncbi:MAG: hypothetical protein U0Q16_18375 [Bryobacteraceae bacterium]
MSLARIESECSAAVIQEHRESSPSRVGQYQVMVVITIHVAGDDTGCLRPSRNVHLLLPARLRQKHRDCVETVATSRRVGIRQVLRMIPIEIVNRAGTVERGCRGQAMLDDSTREGSVNAPISGEGR